MEPQILANPTIEAVDWSDGSGWWWSICIGRDAQGYHLRSRIGGVQSSLRDSVHCPPKW